MKAKPFIKWVGGKSQLIEEDNFFDVLYEPYNRARVYEQNGTPNIVIRNYQIQ